MGFKQSFRQKVETLGRRCTAASVKDAEELISGDTVAETAEGASKEGALPSFLGTSLATDRPVELTKGKTIKMS